ncbi:MAG: hypothetical protein JNL98_12495 [Bryobacterales bacterium]|nr:hypothetical protein [Bryobacterales bacterium]
MRRYAVASGLGCVAIGAVWWMFPVLEAQSGPAQLPLSATQLRSATIPAGSSTSYIDVILDPAVSGGDTLDVVASGPGISVGLIRPDGVEVSAGNASALGYGWTGVTPASAGTVLAPVLVPLPHTVITLPPSAPPGTYRVKVVAVDQPNPGEVLVTYTSSSAIRAAFGSKSASYRVGDSAVLTAVVLRESTPVAGVSTNVTLRAAVDVSSQVSIQNVALQSSTAIDSATTKETYTATIRNSGSALRLVVVTPRGIGSGPPFVDGFLSFGDVAANSSKAAVNTFSVIRPNGVPFHSSALLWRADAQRDMGQVSLSAGQSGVFSGAVPLGQPGRYTATLNATGTSSGVAFARTASTVFDVEAPTATFVSFQDQAIDDNGNGLSDRIVTTANLSVLTAGVYRFAIHLKGSNSRVLLGSTTGELGVGSTYLSVSFTAKEIRTLLGVNGPYQRVNATLTRVSDEEAVADVRAEAGSTTAWALASLDAGNLYLTGQNRATRIDTGPEPGYEILRASIGVSYTEGGRCSWSAGLVNAYGMIDYVNSRGELLPGSNVITIDFSGPKIRENGRDGPYRVSDFSMRCADESAGSSHLLTTEAYPASQFALLYHFTLSASPASVTLAAGSAASVVITGSSPLDLVHPIQASVSGVPPNVAVEVHPSVLMSLPRVWKLRIQVLPSAQVGTYQLTFHTLQERVNATPISFSFNLPLAITAQSGKTVAASPIGPVFVVNGVYHREPVTFSWPEGSTAALSAASPQDHGDSRYTFLNWSDGGAMAHTVTAPSGSASYVANFSAMHRLYVESSPRIGGTVNLSESFYPAGTPIPVTATPNPGWVFDGWKGPKVEGGAQGMLTLDRPSVLTARFKPSGAASLSWAFTSKVGEMAERLWEISMTNVGPSGVHDAELEKLMVIHTGGPACTPLLQSELPRNLGDFAPGATSKTTIKINFQGCASTSAFSLNGQFMVNGRAAHVWLWAFGQTP